MSLSDAGRCPKSRGGYHRWIARPKRRSDSITEFECFVCKMEAAHTMPGKTVTESECQAL